MSYKYEKKIVVKSWLQLICWGIAGFCGMTLVLATMAGVFHPSGIQFATASIQGVFGTILAVMQVDTKRVRVEITEEVVEKEHKADLKNALLSNPLDD